MSVFAHDAFAAATGGVWLRRPRVGAEITGVGIDTRTLRTGQAFFAIRGERFDGHDFIEKAAEARASAVVVERAPARDALRQAPPGVGVLEVDGCVRALGELAAAHRASLTRTTVIGVTGSNGKTTTCRILGAVLGGTLRGVVSQKSFNNHLGVPLTLLGARREDDFVVCEMGTSSPGEIGALVEIACPDICVITSIGRAHTQGLGGIEGVRREKASICEGMLEGGLCLAPSDDPELLEVIDSLDLRSTLRTFGAEADADVRVAGVRDAQVTRDDGETVPGVLFEVGGMGGFALPIPGAHNARNAAAAIGVAAWLHLDEEEIRAGLLRARAPEMRMQRREIGGVAVYNDAYNANPDSVAAALRSFAQLGSPAARRICVLGEMLEIGPGEREAHEEIGALAASLGVIDEVVCVGALAAHTAEAASSGGTRAHLFASLDDAAQEAIVSLLRPGDAVLLKASRAAGLERLEQALERAETLRPPACSSHSST